MPPTPGFVCRLSTIQIPPTGFGPSYTHEHTVAEAVVLDDDGREQRDLTLEQRHGLEHLRALSQLIESLRMPIFL